MPRIRPTNQLVKNLALLSIDKDVKIDVNSNDCNKMVKKLSLPKYLNKTTSYLIFNTKKGLFN